VEPAVKTNELSGTGELVAAAAGGDQGAWDCLVERYGRVVWAVARSHRLSDADAADVSQTTWLRLVEHIDRIHEPERLGGWLATTAQRESLRLLRYSRREVPFLDEAEEPGSPDLDPEAQAVARDEGAELRAAYATLSERCQALLRVVAVTPLGSYAEISAALGIPVGSIGPTRSRCLDQLRAKLAA
jgi:RNA polymerase sigma factor (sigma-70 family)